MICPVCKMWTNDANKCGCCGFDVGKMTPGFIAVWLVIGVIVTILSMMARGM